jgi:hypothetical protein
MKFKIREWEMDVHEISKDNITFPHRTPNLSMSLCTYMIMYNFTYIYLDSVLQKSSKHILLYFSYLSKMNNLNIHWHARICTEYSALNYY